MTIKKNPNSTTYVEISKAITENDGYCVCALEKNKDTQCICKEFQETDKQSFCHCGRYYKVEKFPIITLCGSSKFKKEFLEVQKQLTLEGYIVISLGVFGHSDDTVVITEGIKRKLDEIHKAKIEMSDAIFVINKNGYIGSSTQSEIEWAEELGKTIYYLEKR